jgi:hypothetical protein
LSFRVAAQLRPAYLWLIGARAKASPNADIWDLRRNWSQLRQSLKQQITTGTYLFAPLQRVRHATGPAYSWSAQDALVLKALTLALADILPTHDICTHVAGRHLPLKKGRLVTTTHDYRRHRTTTLFAALEVKWGTVIGD